ncbi:hypothetical protein LXA43DRAFT_1183377 [Ganoderma leucocontextum]|nr:hypothetical protein LXA43DRAFT_1183377 [Ganoderma leucocontextum]
MHTEQRRAGASNGLGGCYPSAHISFSLVNRVQTRVACTRTSPTSFIPPSRAAIGPCTTDQWALDIDILRPEASSTSATDARRIANDLCPFEPQPILDALHADPVFFLLALLLKLSLDAIPFTQQLCTVHLRAQMLEKQSGYGHVHAAHLSPQSACLRPPDVHRPWDVMTPISGGRKGGDQCCEFEIQTRTIRRLNCPTDPGNTLDPNAFAAQLPPPPWTGQGTGFDIII